MPVAFPEYSKPKVRLASFEKCPIFEDVKIREKYFVEAGFFYTGKDDETVCYYCGGGLKEWSDIDDPWKVHAQWFSKCPFVLVHKGQDFVDKYSNRKNKKVMEKRRIPTDRIVPPDDLNKQHLECVVCLSAPRNILCLPCMHCATCASCGFQVDDCVYCRTPIVSVMKIYLV